MAKFEFHQPMSHLWWEFNWTSILDSFAYAPISFTANQIIVQGVPGGGGYAGWRLVMTPVTTFSGSMSSMNMPEGLVATIELRDPSGVLFLTARDIGLTFSDIRILGITSQADTFTGTSGADSFAGGHEADHLRGLDGADRLWGDNGDDQIEGGAGDDYLEGGMGADRLEGGAGDDEIWGGRSGVPYYAGDDLLLGGDGDDLLRGGVGNDVLDGGAGQDTTRFAGRARESIVTFESDRIVVFGPDGKDILTGVEVIRFDDGVYERDLIVCLGETSGEAASKGTSSATGGGDPGEPPTAFAAGATLVADWLI